MPRNTIAIQSEETINMLGNQFMELSESDFFYSKICAVVNVPDGRYAGKFYYPDQGFGRGQKSPGDANTNAGYAHNRIGPKGRQPMTFQLANGSFEVLEQGVSSYVSMRQEAEYRETFGSNASLVQMVSNHLLYSAWTDLDDAVSTAANTAGNWANSNTPGTLWNAGTPGNMLDDINASVARLRAALPLKQGSKRKLMYVGGQLVLEDLQGSSQMVDQLNATSQSLAENQGNDDIYAQALTKFLGFGRPGVFVDTTEDTSREGADESFADVFGRGFLVANIQPGNYTADNAPWDSALLMVENMKPTIFIEEKGVGNAAGWEINVDYNHDVVTRSVSGDHWANPTS